MDKWTIFGVSDLILEIIDAIHCDKGIIEQIVINMPLKRTSIEDLRDYKIVKLEDYKYDYEFNIFGFTDPNKEDFLSNLPGIEFTTVFHPHCHIDRTSRNSLGKGNYIAPGTIIGAKVRLGSHNIVNRHASIGHHTEIDSCNHLGPGSVVCGRCQIGCKNFIGAGSVIKDRVKIGNGVTIGAGAVVTSDILESGVYVGIPAKKISGV